MIDNSSKEKIKIWFQEDLILTEQTLSPLLRHIGTPTVGAELEFWSLLENELKNTVEIYPFQDLDRAGSLVVTPHSLAAYRSANKLATLLKLNQEILNSGRTLVTFTGGIDYKPKHGEIVFATSTYQNKQERSIATPAWLFDLGSKISPIEKPVVPTVGFVGDTKYPGRLSDTVSYLPLPDFIVSWLGSSMFINRSLNLRERQVIARLVRRRTIDEFRKASNLQIQLIERSGGFFSNTQEEQERYRNEYLQNMQDNAYIICVRGDENCSYRLYETMSAGRIPVIIDTNMELPKLNSIGWEEFSAIVPYANIHKVGESIQGFHDKMSDLDFKQVCLKSRAAFEALLPHKFILENLKKKLSLTRSISSVYPC
jgi:Exostosin family